MRTSAPKRIGVVLSLAWLIGATAWQLYAGFRISRTLTNGAFEICDYVNYRLMEYNDCWQDLTRAAAFLDGSWSNLALISLAPILFGWLAAYIALVVWRSVRAAFGR
jgi:hypothetical protein